MTQAYFFPSRRFLIFFVVVMVLISSAAHIKGQQAAQLAGATAADVKPDLFVDGDGKNIDSPEIWMQPKKRELYLFVSGKKNDLVEKWSLFSPKNQELTPLALSSRPNGLAVDDENEFLMIGDSEKLRVSVYTLPDLSFVKNIGKGEIKKGETNMDVLNASDGRKIVLVSEDDRVLGFDLATEQLVLNISPKVDSIEEVLADNYHKIIYIPEEHGGKSKIYQGGAVLAFREDGTPFTRSGTNAFGQGKFSGDEEGIALYRCQKDGQDAGKGFVIVANQSHESNSFEFFDRETWHHLASVKLEGVTNTDGIESFDEPLPNYPQGLFAAVNNDKDVALVSWEKILSAAKLSCQ